MDFDFDATGDAVPHEAVLNVLLRERENTLERLKSIDIAQGVLALVERSGRLDELQRTNHKLGLPAQLADPEHWAQLKVAYETALDEIEDDVAYIDRLGKDSDIGLLCDRGMFRNITLMVAEGDDV